MASKLAPLFRRLRARSGLSQELLAERAGLSYRTVSEIESGVLRRRRAVTLHLLADALNLDAEERSELLRTAFDEGLDAPHEGSATPSIPPSRALIGRDEVLADLRSRFSTKGSAFVTLTGPPGVGKTAVALQFAAGAASRFAGGIAFAALDTITDPRDVLPLVARALGLDSSERGTQLFDYVVERLRSARTLLILDNIEHVLEAGSEIAELLRAAPDTSVLATGRAPFNLSAEQEVPVAPLRLDDAVALFLDRAKDAYGEAAPGRDERADIARVCTTLDRLPLAIELAALRARSFSAAQLADRIWDLVSQGPRDAPKRHQALDAAIAWSYELLDERVAAGLRSFAVFSGGATVEAVEAVCDMHASAIDGLVRQNLLVVEGSGAARRLRMLEPIREFANARLQRAGEYERAAARHALYYCRLAESIYGCHSRATLPAALATFDADRRNFHAVHDSNNAARWDTAVRTIYAVRDFYRIRRAGAEVADSAERLVAAAPAGADPEILWRALDVATTFGFFAGRFEAAMRYSDRALALAGELKDDAVKAWTLGKRSLLLFRARKHDEAIASIERGLELARSTESGALYAFLENALGANYTENGQLETGERHYRKALETYESLQMDTHSIFTLVNLGWCCTERGAFDDAEAYLSRALELGKGLDFSVIVATAYAWTANTAVRRGDLARARSALISAFEILANVQDFVGLLSALEISLDYLTPLKRFREAAIVHGFWRRRYALRDEAPQEQARHEAGVARASAELGTGAFEEYCGIGASLAVVDILEMLRETEPATA